MLRFARGVLVLQAMGLVACAEVDHQNGGDSDAMGADIGDSAVGDASIDRSDALAIDSSSEDASSFDTGVESDAGPAIYWGNCLPKIAAGSPSASFMYYSEVTFLGGKAAVAFYPLNEKATRLSKAETVGEPQIATGIEITPDNTFVANIGNVKVPGNAQRIGDSDMVLINVSYQMRFLGKERLCAEMQGQLTAPMSASLDTTGDICVWTQLPDGATLPTSTNTSGATFVGIPNEDYHCP